MWRRYVDDTFLLWAHQEDVQALMDHEQSIHPSIQFRIEKEQDNKLSFLDMLIIYTDQGFSTSVYRKPSFTGQYLNFNSHHPYTAKKGIVRCLQHRTKAISSIDVYQEEMNRLRYPPSKQLPKEDNINSKKFRSQDRGQNPKTYHFLSTLCERLG